MMLVIVDTGMHICLIVMMITAPLAAIGHLADAWLKRLEGKQMDGNNRTTKEDLLAHVHNAQRPLHEVIPDLMTIWSDHYYRLIWKEETAKFHDDGQTARAVYPDGEKQDGLHHCFHCYLNAQKGNWETFRRTTEPNATHYDAASDWSDPECKWYCEVHWPDIQSLRRSLDELYGR